MPRICKRSEHGARFRLEILANAPMAYLGQVTRACLLILACFPLKGRLGLVNIIVDLFLPACAKWKFQMEQLGLLEEKIGRGMQLDEVDLSAEKWNLIF